jgi:hypothetical protein
VPTGVGEDFTLRHSFCCAVDGCRSRVTPPSLRFLGRKVYGAAVVVVMSAERGSRSRLAKLRAWVGVSWRTLKRWAAWWQVDFPATRFWRTACGHLAPPPPSSTSLPAALLERFGDGEEALVAMLRFIAPITTGTANGASGAA